MRIAILLKYGGFYLDTDLCAIKPLNTISAPYGFLYYLKSMEVGRRESYTNDIQAAIPGHPLYAMAAYIVQKNYTVYGIGDGFMYHRIWKMGDNETEINNGVILSFGLVVKDAMEHLKARDDMIIHDESLARHNFLEHAEINLHKESNWRAGLCNEQQRCSMIQPYIEQLTLAKIQYYPTPEHSALSLRCMKALAGNKSPQFLSVTVSTENAFSSCYELIKSMIRDHKFETFINGFLLFSNSTKIEGNKNITRVAYDLYRHINMVLDSGSFNIENEKTAIRQFLVRLNDSHLGRRQSTKEFYKKLSNVFSDFLCQIDIVSTHTNCAFTVDVFKTYKRENLLSSFQLEQQSGFSSQSNTQLLQHTVVSYN